MRVLFVNGADAAMQAHGGGDAIIMREMARCMRTMGVDVVIAESSTTDWRGFDLLHLFNVEMGTSALRVFRHLKLSGLPLVVSPIYWDQWEFYYGATVVEEAYGRMPPHQRGNILGQLAMRNVVLNGRGYAATTPFTEQAVAEKREIVAGADMVLVSGQTEAACLIQTLGLEFLRWRIAVYGVAPELFESAPRRRRQEPYVLFTGRWLDPKKNVLLMSEALGRLSYPLVIIGDDQPPQREEMVRAHLPAGTQVLGRMSQADLVPWYFGARVHCLPSWYEIPGIVSIEAAATGRCQVVCSARGSQVDYFGHAAYYCDPFNVASIRASLAAAWEAYDQDLAQRKGLRERVLREFTWRRGAEQTLEAYHETLARRLGRPARRVVPRTRASAR